MMETGEPYAAARRAVVTEHRAAGEQIPSPDAGCALRMSGEIHNWLADLRGSDPAATGGTATVTRSSARHEPGSPMSSLRWSGNWVSQPGQKA
jgi:hypothetical protein